MVKRLICRLFGLYQPTILPSAKELEPAEQKQLAQELLTNPIYNTVHTAVEMQMFRDFKQADSFEKREAVWSLMQGLRKFDLKLRAYMSQAIPDEKEKE